MRLICELSGEHPDLPFAELELIGRETARNPQVAVIEADSPSLAGRLSLTRYVLAYLGECEADLPSFTSLLRELELTPSSPFSARVRIVAGSSMTLAVPELEKIMGSAIRGRVRLVDPAVEFRAVFSADRCYIGRVLYRTDPREFSQRRPGSRLFFHPGVMMPRMARALVNNPAIILADEPTGNLDSKTSIDIMELFHDIHFKGNTIILVTHEEMIARHAHRIIRLLDGHIESDQVNPEPQHKMAF